MDPKPHRSLYHPDDLESPRLRAVAVLTGELLLLALGAGVLIYVALELTAAH